MSSGSQKYGVMRCSVVFLGLPSESVKNKVKTTGMYSSFRGLMPLSQGVGRIMLPLKPQKEDPLLPLPTSGSPRCSLPCNNITLIFASISYGHFLCVFFCPNFLLFRIPSYPDYICKYLISK